MDKLEDIILGKAFGSRGLYLVSVPNAKAHKGTWILIHDCLEQEVIVEAVHIWHKPNEEDIAGLERLGGMTIIPAEKIYDQSWEADF